MYAGKRLYSTAAARTKSAGVSSLLKRTFQVTTTVGVASGLGVFIALENDPFRHHFEKLPFARGLLDFVEERNYQRHQRMSWEAQQQQNTAANVTPYIKSQRPKTEQDDIDLNSTTKAKSHYDPLSPEKFFDAQSGKVGGGKEYLPLLLLPDDRDSTVHKVSVAMNDLISSVNSNAPSRTTIDTLADALQDLSEADCHPTYAKIFKDKANKFRQLGPMDRLDLATAILETENDLVTHVNSHKLPPSPPPAAAEKPIKRTETSVTPASASSHAFSFDSSRYDTIIRLQLTLALLVSAMHHHFPVTTYVQDVKDTVATYSPASKQKLLQDALQDIAVPNDVNLKPIINDIINS